MNRSSRKAASLLLALIGAGLAAPLPVIGAAPPATTVVPAPIAASTLPDFARITERYGPAVVNISVTGTRRGPATLDPEDLADPFELFRRFQGPGRITPREVPVRGMGSGFIVGPDGVILTNAHVVRNATEVTVKLTDRREYRAKVLGSDPKTDVAVLKIEARDLPVVTLGRAKDLRAGEWVLAIGSPFGFENTVTAGVVSAKARSLPDDSSVPFIQTDVAVNPGNSGGPLIDLSGRVVGVNSQIVSRSGGFMGISLAIPIDEAMQVVEQLKEHGKVTRGRIGVQIGNVSEDVAKAIGLPKAMGAMVSNVERGSPADKAGVRSGDVITAFNGKEITHMSDLPRLVGNTKPGTRAPMQVWRKGKNVALNVVVGEMPGTEDSRTTRPGTPPASQADVLGLTVTEVPAALREKYQFEGGVQVAAVEGPAAEAGLTDGDIILTINDTDVASPAQYAEIIGKLDRSRPAAVLVMRGEQSQWVTITPRK